MKVRHPVLKTFQAYFLWMTLQCRKHWSSFQFLLRVSPKRYIFLPIIIYFGRKTKETGVTFYYLIYFPLKFDLFIVFIILFMKVEDTPFLEGHSTAKHLGFSAKGVKGNKESFFSEFPLPCIAVECPSKNGVSSTFMNRIMKTINKSNLSGKYIR